MKIVVLTLVLLLSACESSQIYQKAPYKTNIAKKYPAVSIIVNDGLYDSFKQVHMHQGIVKSLRKANVFKRISVNNNTITSFTFDIRIQENSEENFVGIMILALTLGLIPTERKRHFDMDVTILYKNSILKKLHYSTDGTELLYIGNNFATTIHQAMDSLVSYLLSDIEKEKVFEGTSILKKIKKKEMKRIIHLSIV
ncbi:hypothetical protein [Bathymodiolus thermophilus thioautotrophic gill symbiont]|uniref:Lipoprotein n=1 Tax=Bathymodiolus thermophilus thioautotrophic gill symbiont TaxID=2360 RepID=A0A8H8XFU8_9GAMM|nr:hypothetical protein [Bathymodiolus thermophilus thioautotrophic gill symbiont]CAB5504648.1 hypothetical protein THERMOS_1998 [Bathymodiolus thermophilus thioautotrophic gill symbiont]